MPPTAALAAGGEVRLHYVEQGQGPAVVFLHGLGSSAADWQWQIPVFAQHYRALAPDLRGHGQSAAPGQPLTIPRMAADIAAWLERLSAGPAHVVGLSLGGCVAQWLALHYPAHVRSLTLVNTFARLRPAGWQGAGRLLRRAWLLCFAPMPATAAYIAAGLFPKPEQTDYRTAATASLGQNSRRTYFAAIGALLAFDTRRQLPALRCPTLVVAGDRDTTVGLAAKAELQRLIPGARLVVVADSGHATPYDQMGIFNQAVLEFIERLEV